MTLAEAREAISEALNTVAGLNVRPRPIKTPKTGDGWVIIGRLQPADFTSCQATFTAVVILGADAGKAEVLFEQYAVACIDAVTSNLSCADVSAEAQALVAGTSASPIYALAVSLTTEVE